MEFGIIGQSSYFLQRMARVFRVAVWCCLQLSNGLTRYAHIDKDIEHFNNCRIQTVTIGVMIVITS